MSPVVIVSTRGTLSQNHWWVLLFDQISNEATFFFGYKLIASQVLINTEKTYCYEWVFIWIIIISIFCYI